jgi:hypothetical protein
VRTWSHGTTTSAYAIGMVTPLLAPGFIATAFAVTVEQKRRRLLHTELISRLVPEWSEVPFVGVSTGKSTAARVWDGDGVAGDRAPAGHRTRIDHPDGPPGRGRRCSRAVRGDRADPRALQQFTWLAVASEQLEPGSSRPATSATYARITAPPKPVEQPGSGGGHGCAG